MEIQSDKTEQMARKLGLSAEAVEQYIQLKRIEMTAALEPAEPAEAGENPERGGRQGG